MTQLTPAGSGGVAVLRVAGTAAVARLRQSFSGDLPGATGIAYGVLRDPDAAGGDASEVFDEVLVVRAHPEIDVVSPVGRASDDAFELHTHGSPFVVGEIMARLDPAPSIDGAEEEPVDRPSHRPFRRRAQSLVHRAPSGLGARILLDQAAGAMDEAFARIKGLPLGERGAQLHRIVERGRASQRLLKESTVAIVGPVNAGKSTLFNVLVGADAASVSSEAGTTRDALLERAHIGPWPVRFLDTAGERDLTGLAASGDRSAQVEQAGQRIAQDLASRADLVLRLVPFDGAFQPREASSQEVLLGTQAAVDLGPMPDAWPPFTLSAKEAPDHARDVVQAAFESALGLRGLGELWIPGEAVPFDSQSLGMLADVAKLPEVDDRTLDSALEHL